MTSEATADLRHAIAVLRRQNDDASHRVACRLQRWFDADADTTDDALGVRRQPDLRRRDQLICEAVAVHYAEFSREQAAELLASDLAQYAVSGWLRERNLHECPPRLRRRVYEYCWEILRAYDRVIGKERIKQVLRAGN